MKDTFAATLLSASGLLSLLSLARPAAVLLSQALPGPEWISLLEKAGTVGILVWMVMWYQKRLDLASDRLAQMTTGLIESNKELAATNKKLAEALAEIKAMRLGRDDKSMD